MSVGLRQLNLFTALDQSNLINIAYLIIERLSYLQVIELCGLTCELVEMPHILINGLSKLNFLILSGSYECDNRCGIIYGTKLRALQNSNTRSFRMVIINEVKQEANVELVF